MIRNPSRGVDEIGKHHSDFAAERKTLSIRDLRQHGYQRPHPAAFALAAFSAYILCPVY
jgi:hypothetical protein